MKMIDRASLLFRVSAHGSDPKRATGMYTAVIRTRRGIIGFEGHQQRQVTTRNVANIETIVRREQLAMTIDEGDHAGHDRQCVGSDQTACQIGLKQDPVEDIEPPRGIGGGIVGQKPSPSSGNVDRKRISLQRLPQAIRPSPGAFNLPKIDTAR